MKAIVKEYVIVRSLLEKDPTYQKRLEGIDTFIQTDGLDEIYKYVEEQDNKKSIVREQRIIIHCKKCK